MKSFFEIRVLERAAPFCWTSFSRRLSPARENGAGFLEGRTLTGASPPAPKVSVRVSRVFVADPRAIGSGPAIRELDRDRLGRPLRCSLCVTTSPTPQATPTKKGPGWRAASD